MKTKYCCEFCNQEFKDMQQCCSHEQTCAVVPDWIAVGKYIANTFGEVWKIDAYCDSERTAVATQVPLGIAGPYPVRKRISVADIVRGYDPATVSAHCGEDLPTGALVYVPGEFTVGDFKDNCVILTSTADKEASLQVPLEFLHRLCVHAGTEVPVADVKIYDDHDDEEYALLELVDRGCI